MEHSEVLQALQNLDLLASRIVGLSIWEQGTLSESYRHYYHLKEMEELSPFIMAWLCHVQQVAKQQGVGIEL